MAYKFLATMNIINPDAPEEYKFTPVGRLLYDLEYEKAKLYMFAWTLGWASAFPRTKTTIEEPPYIHGDLTVCMGSEFDAETKERKLVWQKIGRIVSGEKASGGVHYSAEFTCIPAVARTISSIGVWVEVHEEHNTPEKTT